MKIFLWIALMVGALALIWAASSAFSKPAAPLNTGGYTYAGTPGA